MVAPVAVFGTPVGPGPVAWGDPDEISPVEQRYLAQLYGYVHPPVTAERLVQLGNLTCAVRRSGGSTEAAKERVWQSLEAQGVVSSRAEIGTLVHVAVDNICPEVGYP
ncbi:DUF732 domain-containing protein [Mycolicibacterium hassiacum]